VLVDGVEAHSHCLGHGALATAQLGGPGEDGLGSIGNRRTGAGALAGLTVFVSDRGLVRCGVPVVGRRVGRRR